MAKVIAMRLHPYGGQYHKKGATYEISSQKDLRILAAIGAVRLASGAPTAKQRKKSSAKKKPETSEAATEKRQAAKAEADAYDRKDLRARESYRTKTGKDAATIKPKDEEKISAPDAADEKDSDAAEKE